MRERPTRSTLTDPLFTDTSLFRSLGGERADEAVGEPDAEEGADKSAADQLAEALRRRGDGAHGLDHAEHRGDDAQCRHAIGHDLQGMGDFGVLVVHHLDLLVHQRFHLVRVVGAESHHAQVVARSEAHTSELQSLMRISYAVFCLKNNTYPLSPTS